MVISLLGIYSDGWLAIGSSWPICPLIPTRLDIIAQDPKTYIDQIERVRPPYLYIWQLGRVGTRPPI